MYPWSHNSSRMRYVESGFALIVTLLLLLVLMLMAAGIAYMGSAYVDLSNAVSLKPQAINAAETCVDQATDWLKTNDGINWVTGVGSAFDLADPSTGPLYQHNLLTDTAPTGVADNRSSEFKNMAGRGGFKSCVIQKSLRLALLALAKKLGRVTIVLIFLIPSKLPQTGILMCNIIQMEQSIVSIGTLILVDHCWRLCSIISHEKYWHDINV